MTGFTPWPAPFDPDRAPVSTHNEVHSAVSADVLWPTLIRATAWPEWYQHSSGVALVGGRSDLALGSVFTWRTVGVNVRSTVTEFEQARILAWSGIAPASRGYHRWLFEPTPDGGCTIVTEEIQQGFGPRLLAKRLQRELTRNHQEWLEGLVAQHSPAKS